MCHSSSTPSVNLPTPTDPPQILKLSCAPSTITWPHSPPPPPHNENQNSLHLLSGKSHLLLLWPLSLLTCPPPPPPPPPFTPKYCLFSVTGPCHFSDCHVWAHCKYFQYNITVSKSLPGLPGGKQNSHLRFSRGAFSANIIAARPPPSAGTKTIHLSMLGFFHNLPQKRQVISV